MESTILLDNIFDKTRVSHYYEAFPLFFYFPLGLTIVVLRFFIGAHAFFISFILKPFPTVQRFVLRIMCIVLGFIIIEKQSEQCAETVKVFVANHITNYDHLSIKLVKSCIVPSVWDIPSLLNWILGYTDFEITQGRSIFIKNVQNFIKSSNLPILAFPEGATTNGKVGMLKFSQWPSLLGESLQPIAIQIIQPPLIHVSLSVLGSRWWSDIFWLLFMPYTVYVLRYLPVMTKSSDETHESFCARVQCQMCKELDLQPTTITAVQKVQYAKQYIEGDKETLIKKSH